MIATPKPQQRPNAVEIGMSCILHRPDSKGYGKHARIDRVEPSLPFPIHVSGVWGGAWVLPIEIEPSRLC